jgi:hypothetical protein
MFQIFRNVVPKVDFYKGKNGNPGGEKNHGGWDEKISHSRFLLGSFDPKKSC